MFGKAAEALISGGHSLIQDGVAIRGDLKAENDVRVDGKFEGTLVSKSRVIVGSTGTVQADIEGSEVVVMGSVTGKVTGHRRVELRKGAHVEGDLSTQSLVIEDGVFFQGLCHMSPPAGSPKDAHSGSRTEPALDRPIEGIQSLAKEKRHYDEVGPGK